MKNKVLLRLVMLSLFMAFCVGSSAQETYQPLIQSDKCWSVLVFNLKEKEMLPIELFTYIFDLRKSEFNGKEYTEINYYDYVLDSESFPALSTWLREEDRKVYLYDEATDTEKLLYDFSLDVGDTFKGLGNTDYVVISKTLEQQDTDVPRSKWVLRKQGSNATDDDVVWVEGIGSCYGPLQPLPDERNDSIMSNLVFSGNRNTHYYSFDLDYTQSDWKGSRASITSIPKEDSNMGLEYKLIDGKLVVEGNVYSLSPFVYLYCISEGADSFKILLAYNGLVGCGGTIYKIHADFSGFTQDRVTVTDYWNSYLVSPEGSVPLGILLNTDKKESPTEIYSLDGRRLQQVPEKGVYIKGGKKYVK